MDPSTMTEPEQASPPVDAGPQPPVAREPIRTRRADQPLVHRVRGEWTRVRRSFTMENAKQFAKTLIWVVPLTVIIWVYAEQEQIQDENVTVHVTLASSDANKVIENLQPANGEFIIDLQGPRAALDNAEAAFRGADVPITLNTTHLDADGKPVRVSAGNQIAANDVLVKNGVNILHASPESLTFSVDDLITADATIRAPPGLNLDSARFDPPVVQLRGPRRLIQSFRDNNNTLYVTADLADFVSQRKPGEIYPIADVPLLKPGDDPQITLLTTKVSGQVQIKATDVRFKIDSRPIWISTPQSFPKNVTVTLGGGSGVTLVTDIWVSGPPDQIKTLDDPNVLSKVHAVVSIPGAAPDHSDSIPIEYVGLPPGVSFVSDARGGHISYTIGQ